MAVESVPVHTDIPRALRPRVSPASRFSGGSGRRAPGPEAGGQARAAAGPAGAGLGSHAKTAATAGQSFRVKWVSAEQAAAEREEKRIASRAQKAKLRRGLSEITELPRVHKCGRISVIEGGLVYLRHSPSGGQEGGASAGYGGLATCGSVWACPCCSAKVASKRVEELTKLITWNAQRGGSVALLTLTMRHNTGHRLRELRRGLTKAWRHITSSRGWKDAKKLLGMDGYVRAIECTVSEENGWHLHIHALMLFDGPISQEMVDLLAAEVWERWSTGLAREGLSALQEHAVDVRVGNEAVEHLAGYLNKLAFETAGARWKKGRKAGRTPFELLSDALSTGLAADVERWWEWEKDSLGMRQLVWSRGLKDRVGVADKDDEELAAEEESGQTIAVLPASTWRAVYGCSEDLLTVTEQAGPEGAFRWLELRGLRFDVHQPASDDDPAPPALHDHPPSDR